MRSEFKYEDFDIDFKDPLGEDGFGAVYKATKKKYGSNLCYKKN